MSNHDEIHEILEIDFEVGHCSIIRSEATTNHNPPRTHDWKVYLRSSDVNGDLNCLIKRCVFNLHPEFPNHKRELKSTPFAVQETGYAGFRLPIDIYFKSKKDPKQFSIEYDLDLHKNVPGRPYRKKDTAVRRYRCTFYNPDQDFRQKILAAGGKIVDSGPILSNDIESDLDEDQASSPEPPIRHSPPQKRSISPAVTSNVPNNKKIKVEQATISMKKTQSQSAIKNESSIKTIVTTKKQPLTSSNKSSLVIEEKALKVFPIKETAIVNETSQNSSLFKSRPSTKLIKTQSNIDIKNSSQSIIVNNKKKESVTPPSKIKSVANSQNSFKKAKDKNIPKISIKTEQTSTPIVKSPLNINIKQESSPSNAISSNTTRPMSNLKKIPKKPAPSPAVEKRPRSSVISSSLNRNSDQNSQKLQSSSSKTQTNSKRDRSSSSSSSVKTSSNTNRNQSEKPIQSMDKVHSRSRSDQPKPTLSKSSQPPVTTSPSTEVFNNEDNPIQLSEASKSPLESINQFSSAKLISHSDQSDTNDCDISMDDDDDDDLPTSLIDDDLRYKLIYIYNRFRLNSLNDLIIFVRFFKRNHLIDTSNFSMTKTTNEMFTYDLFSLSSSHIDELANDLGYTTTTMINSME